MLRLLLVVVLLLVLLVLVLVLILLGFTLHFTCRYTRCVGGRRQRPMFTRRRENVVAQTSYPGMQQ